VVLLPADSSMRIGMHCTNWGVPKDAAAMISTDSGAWILKAEEKGKVFLRATINCPEVKGNDRRCQGTVQTPAIQVDWTE
jgi:hypothetical protein